MYRIGIDPKLINITKAIYKNPKFKVKMGTSESDWKKQETGIRQGCPLSPYLFLIVMTVLFHDIHDSDHLNTIRHRQDNCNFDEIMYADDTILVSKDTRTLNKMLKEIEEAGEMYGLRLNKGKCVTICMYGNPDIKFKDGTRLQKVEEAVYLGVTLNNKLNMQKEIQKRISNTMIIWKRLGEFWKNCNCTKKDKLHVYQAVIKTKLLYGLESAQLTQGMINKLNTFQLKGIRQILKMDTTYVNRANTNKKVMETASKEMGKKPLPPFGEQYQQQKVKLMGHLLRQCDDEHEKYTTLRGDIPNPKLNPNRRTGQPRQNWAEETLKQIWNQCEEVRRDMNVEENILDSTKESHMQTINLLAHLREF